MMGGENERKRRVFNAYLLACLGRRKRLAGFGGD